MARWMPLPLTISCTSKSRLVLLLLVLPFWYLLTRVVPDIFQKSSKTVVCVCVTEIDWFQARQSRLQVGLNVDGIDDVLTGLTAGDRSCPGFTDLFVEELLTRLTQFTLSPNELQQAIRRTTT